MLNIIILNVFMITAFFLMDSDFGDHSSKLSSDGNIKVLALILPSLLGSLFASLSIYRKGIIPLIVLSTLSFLCFFVGPMCVFGLFQISVVITYYNGLYNTEAVQCQLFIIIIVTMVLCLLVTPKKQISYYVFGGWYLLGVATVLIVRHYSYNFPSSFLNHLYGSWLYPINPFLSKAGFVADVVSIMILNIVQLALSGYSLIAANAEE